MMDLTLYPSALATVTLSMFLVPIALKWILTRRSSRPPLPPGPKGYPIIGNLLEIGITEKPWEVYMKMGEKLNADVVFMQSFGTKILVLNSFKSAMDLLHGRSGIYSDRPSAPMMEEMEMNKYLGFLRYGSMWRRQRRAVHQQLNPSVVGRYHQVISQELVPFIKGLESTPQDFLSHIEDLLSRIIFKTFYGVNVRGKNDPYLLPSLGVIEAINLAGNPGTFFVDLLPALKYVPGWVPGTAWKKFARYHRENSFRARQDPFDNVIRQMKEGAVEPCLASRMIDALPGLDDPERQEEEIAVRDSLASGYIAGSDTTRSLCVTFILLMALHPEVQKKAQAEIDELMPIGQRPTIADRPKLTYLQAVIREVLRWLPPTPLGLPHATTDDDIYENKFIPKGTIVSANLWAMMHDQNLFTRPSEFVPERHLIDEQIDKTMPDPIDIVFGFGRRICPGRYLASDVVYTFVTSTLTLFDISAPQDETGTPMLKSSIETSGALISPRPFKCTIRPRSERHQEAIRLLEG